MSRILAIHWNPQQVQVVVVNNRATGTILEAAQTMPLGAQDGVAKIAEQLAAGIAPYRQGRCQTIVGLDREYLQWQSLTLPPAPANELPDLVRIQAARSMSLGGDENEGLDYLPLAGDEHTPHEVLAIGIDAEHLAEILQIVSTAGLKMDRLIPLETGWMALVRHVLEQQASAAYAQNKLRLFAALQPERVILWATLGPMGVPSAQVVLFRSLRIPGADLPAGSPVDPDAGSARFQTLASELKRTLLALQTAHPRDPVAAVWLVGDRPSTDALNELSQQLELPVHGIDCLGVLPQAAEASASWSLPLAGLALDAAHRRGPPLDLVHPRRANAAQDNWRTYALLAAVAACLLAWTMWHAYQNIQLPQQAAAAANQEAALLQETEATYQADLQLAAALGRWSAGQVNLLDQLERLSKGLRPHPLDANDFSAREDLVLMALNMQRQQFDLDAIAADRSAVGTLEARLRADHYLVKRDNTNRKSELGDYRWPFREIVQLPQQPATSREQARP